MKIRSGLKPPPMITSLVIVLISCSVQDQRPVNLLVESTREPMTIDHQTPRLSWHPEVPVQSAYQVQVAGLQSDLQDSANLVWNSEKVESDSNINIVFEGGELESSRRYYWRVRVWNDEDDATGWSETSWFETAFPDPLEWRAE